MPGETVTLLLGAQGGDEEAFACLYAVTNPVLVRYLRVISDADPATVALSAWSTLLDGLSVCVADDDDDWLELAVGTARQSALAFTTPGTTAVPGQGGTPAVPVHHGSGPEPDPVDAGVAMLRACGPAVAEVLALGVVAGLGRDSIARITGQEPTAVLALVQDGQDALALPLDSLITTMRVPGIPAEVGDLPTVLRLFVAQSRAARPTAAAAALVGPWAATDIHTAALATGAVASAASAGTSTVADLLTWDSPAAATSSVAVLGSAGAGVPSRWASLGASAAAWTIAVGGLGTAAAMSGVIPAVIDGLFGDDGRPVIVAQGPVRPGEVPPQTDGDLGAEPQPSGEQPGQQGTGGPSVGPADVPSGDGVVVVASFSGFGTATGSAVVPAVVTDPPSPVTTPPTPSRPTVTPPTSTPPPPRTGTGTITGPGHAYAYGKGHAKHSTGHAKGRAKAAAAAAKAQAKAAAAKARAAAKASAAKASAAKAKAAQAKAAKAKAATAKAAKSRA